MQVILYYDEIMGRRDYYGYIKTNLHDTTLYTVVTNNLMRRIQEHKRGEGGKFSKKFNLKKLVYCEVYDDPTVAINREKQIKGGLRMKKLGLINDFNPEWNDLTFDLFQ